LDTMLSNLHKLEDLHTEKKFSLMLEANAIYDSKQKSIAKIASDLTEGYENETQGKSYLGMSHVVDRLVKKIEQFINPTDNLIGGEKTYPIYLKDDVYIISHGYNGAPFSEPIIFVQHEKRINFTENHPHFQTDVYYYTDNRSGHIDVFYDAITLELIGYKEKHKEYVNITKSNNYLVIRHSMKDRLMKLGYVSKYIDVSDSFEKNKKIFTDASLNYFAVLNNLIKEHVLRIRLSIDKIMSVLSKIKYYQDQADTAQFLVASKNITKLIEKYGKLFSGKPFQWDDEIFSNWQNIRNTFIYKPAKWKDTNVSYHSPSTPGSNLYVSADIINQYDQTSNLMMYYLIVSFIKILDDNPEKSTSMSVIQLYINIINYVFDLYNMDDYKNASELKRFIYILNGSEYMIDLLKKGQGLDQSRQLEEDLEVQAQGVELDELKTVPSEEELDEIEDLKEEAEALDVEPTYEEDEGDEFIEREAEE